MIAGCSRPPATFSPSEPPAPAPTALIAPKIKAPPYLVLHDWYGDSPVASPSYIRRHRDRLDSLPFDGIAMYVRSEDLSINVSAGVLGTRELSPGEIDKCLDPIRDLKFTNLTQNFAAVLGGRPPDFMDDWSVVVGNFARLARAARAAGLKGIYFDNEAYYKPWGDYPRGVNRKEVPLADYQLQARKRGREVMEAMVAEFPDLVLLVLHGPYLSEAQAPSPLFPQWQDRNELVGPFFAGLVEGAGERSTIVDGGQIYHLRNDREFRESYAWRKDCGFLPGDLREKWCRVRFGFGVYDRPFKGRAMSPQILETTIAHALRRSDSYVWLYIEGPTFLKPGAEGGATPEWIDAVRRARGTAPP